MNKFLFIFILLLLSGINCFSQEEKQISFADNTTLAISSSTQSMRTPNSKGSQVSSISISNQSFTASITGIGKAVPPLDSSAIKALQRKNKTLAGQIRRIDSAYNLTQNNTEFYFAALNSIDYSKFANCSPDKPCQVKCNAVIIQITTKSGKENVLILKSFEMVK